MGTFKKEWVIFTAANERGKSLGPKDIRKMLRMD